MLLITVRSIFNGLLYIEILFRFRVRDWWEGWGILLGVFVIGGQGNRWRYILKITKIISYFLMNNKKPKLKIFPNLKTNSNSATKISLIKSVTTPNTETYLTYDNLFLSTLHSILFYLTHNSIRNMIHNKTM